MAFFGNRNKALLAVAVLLVLSGAVLSEVHDESEYGFDSAVPLMCAATGAGLDCGDGVKGELEIGGGALKGMVVDLLHMDHHPSSPLHEPKITFAARVRNAVKRSKQRVKGVARKLETAKNTQREIDLDFSDVSFSTSSRDSYESPVSASPGSYIMSISLGTPPQTRTAIADTGSDLVWLQCSPCTSCYSQNDPVYNPSKSSSYKLLPCSNAFCTDLPYHACNRKNCKYGYAYGDQSTTQGDFALETITLTTTSGTTELVNTFAFGCGHKNQGTFSGTDGLVGLGQGPISFTSQLGSLFGNKFSYCLVSAFDASSVTSPLIFGDAAVPVSLDLKYTPLVRNNMNPTFYYVLMTGVSVNGKLVPIPARSFDISSSGTGGVILDSGTTITMLVKSAYTPFLAMLKSLVKYPIVDSSQIGLDLCYDLSGVKKPVLPAVTLHFANVDLDLPSDNTFLAVDDQGTTCLAFAGDSDFSIIGNIQQQNFYILHDRQNQRVGFAPTHCDTFSASAGVQAQ